MYIYLDFFEGDYFAELPLRDFLINQFRFRYLEASELVGELRQRITKTLQIDENERDFVCAALDRHGVVYRLQGQPAAAAPAEHIAPSAKTTSAPIVQTPPPAEKIAPIVAPEPVEYVFNAPKNGVSMSDKIGFIKLLRETNRDPIIGDTESLKESKDKADALCEGAQKIRHLVKSPQTLPALFAELQKLGISYHRIDEAPPTATNNFAPPLDTTPTAIQIAPLSPAAVKALSNEKLEFVKNIKMATGTGLKDSKDFADMVLLYPERSHHLPFGDDEKSVKILLAFLAKCGVKLQGQANTPASAPSSQLEVFLISEDGWNHSTGAVSGQKLNMIKWLRTMSVDPETQVTQVGLAEAKAQVDALIEKKTPIRVEIRNKAQRDEFFAFVESLHLNCSKHY